MADLDVLPQEFDLPIGGGLAAGLGQDAFDDIPAPDTLDTGDADVDPTIAFRRTLGMFATGVTVLTTRLGEQVHGMTANAFTSVSLRPPLILVAIDRRARMCSLLHEGTRFGVNVLAEGQAGLSDRFARRRDDVPEPTFAMVRETPLIEGALAHFVVRVVKTYWGGDHSLFLAQVEVARYDETRRPLLFHGGRYEQLVEARRVFASLPPELLEPILRTGAEVEFADGEYLMRIGEPGDTLFLLVEGTVRVQRPGRTLLMGEGEVIGEIEILDAGAGRLADVVAEGRVRCVALSREALRSVLAANPEAAWALLGVLASRFREAQ